MRQISATKRTAIAVGVAIVMTTLAAGLSLAACEIDPADEALPVGTAMPVFRLSGPSGTVSTSDLVGARTVVLFFRTSCGDCHRELPAMQRVWEEFSEERNMHFVCITAEPNPDPAVAEHWRQEGYDMPVYFDTDGAVTAMFNVRRVPTFFLFDKEGKVSFVMVETFELDAEGVIEKVKNL